MFAGTDSGCPLCRDHIVQPLKESRKVMAAAEYCRRAAVFFRSNAICTLSKATLSMERDSLVNCCCRTRLDAEFKGEGGTKKQRNKQKKIK